LLNWCAATVALLWSRFGAYLRRFFWNPVNLLLVYQLFNPFFPFIYRLLYICRNNTVRKIGIKIDKRSNRDCVSAPAAMLPEMMCAI
jgi:hypothetical protein